jgi:hypothetical protein
MNAEIAGAAARWLPQREGLALPPSPGHVARAVSGRARRSGLVGRGRWGGAGKVHRCQAACRRGLPRRLRARRRRTTTPAASPETTPPAARPAPVSARPGPAAPAARLAGVLARCSSNASFFGVGEATGQEGGLWDGRAVDNAVLAEVVGDRLERVLLRKVERGAQVLAPRVHVRPGLDQRLDQRTPPGARRDRQRRRAVARGRVKVCPARRERLHRRHVVHFNRPVHRRAPRRRPAPAPGAPHAPGAAGLRARAVAARGSARWRVQPPVRLKVRAVRRAEGGVARAGGARALPVVHVAAQVG